MTNPQHPDERATDARTDWDAAYTGDVPEAPVDADLIAVASGLAPGAVLDLGCGSGQNCIWLAQQGWDVLGVDIAPKAVAGARLSAARASAEASFEVADIATWRPDREFDLVTSTYALPPVGKDRDQALSMATRAVAPGGTILIADFDESLAGQGWMSRENLVSVEDLSSAVKHFDVRIAEVRVLGHSHGDQSRSLPVAFVVARRPAHGTAHIAADVPSFGAGT